MPPVGRLVLVGDFKLCHYYRCSFIQVICNNFNCSGSLFQMFFLYIYISRYMRDYNNSTQKLFITETCSPEKQVRRLSLLCAVCCLGHLIESLFSLRLLSIIDIFLKVSLIFKLLLVESPDKISGYFSLEIVFGSQRFHWKRKATYIRHEGL